MAKIIHWKNKITEAEGHGTAAFSDSEAEKIVENLNEEYPYIHHWTVKVE